MGSTDLHLGDFHTPNTGVKETPLGKTSQARLATQSVREKLCEQLVGPALGRANVTKGGSLGWMESSRSIYIAKSTIDDGKVSMQRRNVNYLPGPERFNIDWISRCQQVCLVVSRLICHRHVRYAELDCEARKVCVC